MTGLQLKAQVVELAEVRERRRLIAVAKATPSWMQVVASFALEEITLTDDTYVRAARLIEGTVTIDQACAELFEEYGYSMGSMPVGE